MPKPLTLAFFAAAALTATALADNPSGTGVAFAADLRSPASAPQVHTEPTGEPVLGLPPRPTNIEREGRPVSPCTNITVGQTSDTAADLAIDQILLTGLPD